MEPISKTIKLLDTNCCAHHWNVPPSLLNDSDNNDNQNIVLPKALVVIYHGFLAHGKYPTVRYAAEFLASTEQEESEGGGGGGGYAVIAIDFPGHGQSEGDRGYLPSADFVIDYGVAMVDYAKNLFATKGTTTSSTTIPKLFLVGSSMGGAIALSVAQKIMSTTTTTTTTDSNNYPIAGVVLMAPMLKLNVSSIEHTLLTGLSYIVGSLPLIPSSATDDDKQYRDEQKRNECKNDPLTVSGSRLKVASALTCVDLTLKLQQQQPIMANANTDSTTIVAAPSMLILIADQDVVVKNEGAEDLYRNSPSKDKTKKNYPALHGLLCEPSPLFDQIKQDILNWIAERAK